VILAHNHPSGAAEPSRADEFLTQTLKSALALVDVRVLDHLVVGQGNVVSVRRAGAAVKATPKPVVKAGSLEELALIRAALLEQRRAAEAQLAAEREQAAAERRERNLFATPSARSCRCAAPAMPRRNGRGRRRGRASASATTAAVLVEAISDGFDAESLLDTDDALSFRRRGVGIDVVRKLRRGVWALQGEIDLHGMRREEARDRLAAFLRMAAQSGKRCVRVVHGKGLGSPGREPVLKGKVKSWLMQRSEVLAFTYARPADGGHGALIVLLEPAERTQLSPRSAPPRR
jgi:DNA-nicking Smr family endonuclease